MGHHRAASAAGLAALALACGAGPSAAATPGTPVARCAAKDLAASVRAIDAGAGNRYAALVLTNTSRTACTTRGYVGLQLTGPDGAKVPTRVVRDTSQAAADLTVAPGGRLGAAALGRRPLGLRTRHRPLRTDGADRPRHPARPPRRRDRAVDRGSGLRGRPDRRAPPGTRGGPFVLTGRHP
ncbi:DUF4232 domain-containing protein [Actinacidiphila glaucinigra]|uniref:DUF4232 domain-containing protein n=1 Tax=Actinacidiphila glaucinigra TaxID=235986 RepID=A0A239FT24_9ACTN|nr:DUF4232 domain-containing protein [Actinacidiphila glaucinigra]SNS60001.1 Protein of unknown function [Actinacidiphila glaucinigra]